MGGKSNGGKASNDGKSNGEQNGKSNGKKEMSDEEVNQLAEEAGQEICDQLQTPGNGGKVWIDGWSKKYQQALGTVREFLEANGDVFRVIPGDGSKYTVQLLTEGEEPQEAPPAKKRKGKGGKGGW